MIETVAHFDTVAGSEVVLRLDRQGVGGYVWSAEPPPHDVHIVDQVDTSDNRAAVGDGGTQTYRLAASSPGTYRIVFELRRPWGDRDIAERRIIILSVAPR